jgi:hypothetical protein
MECSQILNSSEKYSSTIKEGLFPELISKKDVNVCQYKNCNKRSTFGKSSDNQPSYCRKHANLDMVCIRNK